MSKTPIPLSDAQKIANGVATALATYCERVEIAGSVRRQKAEVGDIEICAIPKMIGRKNMFGEVVKTTSLLESFPYGLLGVTVKNGTRYKQITMPGGVNLDLFIVLHPAQWGVIFLIRTGSAEFSQKIVTQKIKGGNLPSDCRVKDGAIWRGETMLSTPEEKDFFDLCGMEFVPPEKR